MKELEKCNNQIVNQDVLAIENVPETNSMNPNIIAGVVRRWYIALVVFVLICGLGLPAIWILKKPQRVVKGAIRIAPIMQDILTDKKDSGEISDYEIFMNTQAAMITSSKVIQWVADDLAGKNLSFFKESQAGLITTIKQKILGTKPINTEPAWMLKQALFNGTITVTAPEDTELIEVSMTSGNADEAQQIVDAFINAYMAVGVSNSTQEEDNNLSILEDERQVKINEMESLRQQIYRLAQEYGTATLSSRQDMMLRRVAELLSSLTEVEAEKASLEAKVQLLERTSDENIPPDVLLNMRQDFIKGDPSVAVLIQNIAQLEQELIVSEETMTPTNSNYELQSILLDNMKERLVEAKDNASKEFEELLAEEIEKAGDAALLSTQASLEHIKTYEAMLRDTIAKEDQETVELGRLQLNIDDLQDRLDMTKDRYESVLARIQDLEMQRKRSPRISIYYNADIASIVDKRVKLSAAVIMAGLFFGAWLAFMRDKADLRVRTPEDIVKRIGIRVIGTTTSLDDIKPKHVKKHIIGDYQTISANLGLIDVNGMPKKLVVTSPGMKEGKTTFAINLAMNMAESGKKVLLIDGDLRKPDIARLLDLPKDSRGLQDVMNGVKFEQAVYSLPSIGLDILAADYRDAADACDILSLPTTAERINEISKRYDAVIIDTPPVLAYPDSLIWSKIGNAVILTSFSGQTTLPELKEAKERLTQINAKLIGTIVSSVEPGHSYYRHDFSSYDQIAQIRIAKDKAAASAK